MSEDVDKLFELIKQAKDIVVFSGAGISTESGISDYRSKGGLWDRFQPVTIQEFRVSDEKRKQYWLQKRDLYDALMTAQPNDAHHAVVTLERMGKLKGVVTQNIDGLHEMAGTSSPYIINLHGTNRETICLNCSDITTLESTYEKLKAGDEMPLCDKCDGYLKPNTISFGQSLVEEDLKRAFRWAQECDLCLALGSTLVVEPAASIPRIAQSAGAKLVIITLSETPLDHMADVKIEAKVGELLKQVILNKEDSL